MLPNRIIIIITGIVAIKLCNHTFSGSVETDFLWDTSSVVSSLYSVLGSEVLLVTGRSPRSGPDVCIPAGTPRHCRKKIIVKQN